MLNQHQKHILAVAILTVAAYSLPQVKEVFAETNTNAIACPAGYTCRPIESQPVGCPAGYICSKIETRTVNPSFKIEDTTSGKEEIKSSVTKLEPKYCYTFNFDLDPRNMDTGVSIEKDSGIALFNLQTLLEDKENIDVNNSEREFKNPIFGNSTKDAVKKFQRQNGIPATGFVGPMTRARLNKLYGCNNGIGNVKPLGVPAGADANVGPKLPPTPPVSEKTLYYANANITDVKIINKASGVQVTENTSVTKGETYTISWNASGVPESARFTLIFQSPSNPNIYGVLRTGNIDATKRSYDWKVEDYMLTNTDLRIGIEMGNVRVFSPSFKIIAPTVLNQSSVQNTTQGSVTGTNAQPAVVVAPGIKSIYPASGAPGTKVTLTLNNPKKSQVNLGDFNFGSYGFVNYTNSNNEVITFTVPNDAKTGYYDVIWWGDDVYTVKFNVISQTAPVSKNTGWHYVASVFDSVITLASLVM